MDSDMFIGILIGIAIGAAISFLLTNRVSYVDIVRDENGNIRQIVEVNKMNIGTGVINVGNNNTKK